MNDIHEWVSRIEGRLHEVETKGCPFKTTIENRLKKLEEEIVSRKGFMFGIGLIVVIQILSMWIR